MIKSCFYVLVFIACSLALTACFSLYSQEEMAATSSDILSFYYGTVVSKFAGGELYLDTTGWEPPPTWDPPNRPWHQAAMANPDRTMIADPYVDSETNELVITIARTVRGGGETAAIS